MNPDHLEQLADAVVTLQSDTGNVATVTLHDDGTFTIRGNLHGDDIDPAGAGGGKIKDV